MTYSCRVRCACVLAMIAACVASVCAGASPEYTAVLLGPKRANDAYLAASGPKQVGLGNPPAGGSHAFVWSAQAGNYVDLNPDGFFASFANGGYASADGSEHQVGIALPFQGPGVHRAALWSGTAASYVDLGQATALGGYDTPTGGQQVGQDDDSHAILWSGTAASAVDLTPTGFLTGIAHSGYWTASGARQVGAAGNDSLSGTHAFIWFGTASSGIDLSPAGFSASEAYGGAATQGGGEWQVGAAYSNHAHAILWSGSGSAASAMDITPSVAGEAQAVATNGTFIVGNGTIAGRAHALLWTGPDAADAIDLHGLLPAGFDVSYATGIDAAGNISGYATDASGVNSEAVVWLVPEPASTLVVAVFACALVTRRRGGRS